MDERLDLRTLVEAIAVLIGLDRGQQRLELVFENGHLRSWWSHHERRAPRELAELELDAGDAVRAAAVRYDPRLETRARESGTGGA